MNGSPERRGLLSRLVERIDPLLQEGFRAITYAQQLREERGMVDLIKATAIPVATTVLMGGLAIDRLLAGGNLIPINPPDKFYIAAAIFMLHVVHLMVYPQWPRVFNLGGVDWRAQH